jgi:type II secretory pathway component PulF
MPVYFCRIADKRGRSSTLLREAPSEEVLVRELNKEEVYPLEVRLAPPKRASAPAGGAAARRQRKLSRAAVLEFTSSISLLLSSGLTFRDALEVAQTVFLQGPVSRLVVRLLEAIRKGRTVSDYLDELAGALPPVMRGFVRTGERIGSLESAFQRLTEHLGEEKKIHDRLVGSLIYPVLVLAVAVVGITGIVTFVLPRMQEILAEIGAGLPERIQSAVRLFQGALIAAAVLTGALSAAGALLWALRRRSETAAQRIDRLLLRLPVVGRIRYLRDILNLLFTLEALSSGGFTVEAALEESARTAGNRAFRAGLLECRARVLKGENLSAAFLQTSVFSERIGRWIAVGERSGNSEQVFAQLRRYYQGEIEKWSSRFMSLIEPVLILFVGAVILAMILFFVTPLFSIYKGLL